MAKIINIANLMSLLGNKYYSVLDVYNISENINASVEDIVLYNSVNTMIK